MTSRDVTMPTLKSLHQRIERYTAPKWYMVQWASLRRTNVLLLTKRAEQEEMPRWQLRLWHKKWRTMGLISVSWKCKYLAMENQGLLCSNMLLLPTAVEDDSIHRPDWCIFNSSNLWLGCFHCRATVWSMSQAEWKAASGSTTRNDSGATSSIFLGYYYVDETGVGSCRFWWMNPCQQWRRFGRTTS